MREIKFRGKSINKGEWLFGDLVHDNIGGSYIFPIEAENLYKENAVIPETVGQFTGLTDKNGKEIYEGDIIESRNFIACVRHVIRYDNNTASFVGEWKDVSALSQDWILKYNKKVIGNIHDWEL